MPRSAIVALFALCAFAPTTSAVAQDAPGLGEAVIERGREPEIIALFAPHRLGTEVTPGYRLMNIEVETTDMRVEIVDADGNVAATMRLDHPDRVEHPDATSESFAIETEISDRGAAPAVQVLLGRLRANDDGDFYRLFATPADAEHRMFPREVSRFAFDGIVFSLLMLGLLTALVIREARRSPRWVGLSLLGVTVLGAVLRATLSPHTILGAWPWSRTSVLMRYVWEGPTLGLLSNVIGPIGWLDTVTTLTLVYAIAAPLAVYFDAKRLFEDDRIAVAAAGILAILPCHLRFSHSEVEFVPSITLASAAFGLVHTALRDESRRARVIAMLALPLTVALMLVLRPLNQIFVPLFVATALLLERRSSPLTRRIAVVALLAVVAGYVLVVHFWSAYSTNVSDGLSASTAVSAASTVLSAHNTLINPWITPPGLTLLAGAGVYLGLRQTELRQRTAFVIVWLVLFFVAHAYVVPPEVAMQARYHLHLVVPFAMLGAIGLVALHRKRPKVALAAAAYLALSPLIHTDFLYSMFDDQQELAFLERVRDRVPEDCTVLEYVGRGPPWNDLDARFPRLGTERIGPLERSRFRVIPIGARTLEGDDPLRPEARAVLERPPPCVYYYEGLLCSAIKDVRDPIAPSCDAVRRAVPLERIATTRFRHAPYDHVLAGGLDQSRENRITVTLYRLRARDDDAH